MSLTDPMTKMSKSDPNVKSRIDLLDSPDEVRKKFMSAVTLKLLSKLVCSASRPPHWRIPFARDKKGSTRRWG